MGKILRIQNPADVRLRKIAQDLANGALVVFPTETVYGLGADALDPYAVQRIFSAKKRPADNPLIVHIAELSQLKRIVRRVTPTARKLIREFWPGPLTILLEKKKIVPDVVSAGLPTVGVRMPSHVIARALIRLAKTPIAAPSANLAGKPSPTRAFHAAQDLLAQVDWVIDSGPAQVGVESTIVDCTPKIPVLLRPGGITLEELESVLGKINVFSSKKKKILARAPGMKYRHYSPVAHVWIVPSQKLESIAVEQTLRKRVGVIAGHSLDFSGKRIRAFRYKNLHQLAQNLFHWFRTCDQANLDLILVEKIPDKGIGLAINNRLKKAATKIVR